MRASSSLSLRILPDAFFLGTLPLNFVAFAFRFGAVFFTGADFVFPFAFMGVGPARDIPVQPVFSGLSGFFFDGGVAATAFFPICFFATALAGELGPGVMFMGSLAGGGVKWSNAHDLGQHSSGH